MDRRSAGSPRVERAHPPDGAARARNVCSVWVAMRGRAVVRAGRREEDELPRVRTQEDPPGAAQGGFRLPRPVVDRREGFGRSHAEGLIAPSELGPGLRGGQSLHDAGGAEDRLRRAAAIPRERPGLAPPCVGGASGGSDHPGDGRRQQSRDARSPSHLRLPTLQPAYPSGSPVLGPSAGGFRRLRAHERRRALPWLNGAVAPPRRHRAARIPWKHVKSRMFSTRPRCSPPRARGASCGPRRTRPGAIAARPG